MQEGWRAHFGGKTSSQQGFRGNLPRTGFEMTFIAELCHRACGYWHHPLRDKPLRALKVFGRNGPENVISTRPQGHFAKNGLRDDVCVEISNDRPPCPAGGISLPAEPVPVVGAPSTARASPSAYGTDTRFRERANGELGFVYRQRKGHASSPTKSPPTGTNIETVQSSVRSWFFLLHPQAPPTVLAYARLMAYFICDISALRFWLSNRPTRRMLTHPASTEQFALSTAAARDLPIEQLADLGIRSMPLHVAVSNRAKKRLSTRVFAHIYEKDLPAGSFFHVRRDIFIEHPVLALARTATRLGEVETLRRLHLLTAQFYVHEGELFQRTPLLSKREIETFLVQLQGVPGAAFLNRLLPYLAEGAASPREICVSMLLSLPARKGGYGLPLAQLNATIELADGSVRITDLSWRRRKVILEYDSDTFHIGKEGIGRDAERRVKLQAAGYHVVTLTNRQLKSERETYEVARLLRRRLGLSAFRPGKGFQKRNAELRRKLGL